MRVFITVLVLIFSLQSWTKAEDISDFEIEGMSIGDSLLDFYSKKEIESQLSKVSGTYTNKEIKRIYFDLSNPEIYSVLNIHFVNDPSYKIESIGGIEYFENDMISCYAKQDQVVSDVKKTFPNALSDSLEISEHTSDQTVKSIVRDMSIYLTNGTIYIACTDWSKETTNKHRWTDNLGVYIQSDKFVDWINNKAYK